MLLISLLVGHVEDNQKLSRDPLAPLQLSLFYGDISANYLSSLRVNVECPCENRSDDFHIISENIRIFDK